jgi:hypothetical protein
MGADEEPEGLEKQAIQAQIKICIFLYMFLA